MLNWQECDAKPTDARPRWSASDDCYTFWIWQRPTPVLSDSWRVIDEWHLQWMDRGSMVRRPWSGPSYFRSLERAKAAAERWRDPRGVL